MALPWLRVNTISSPDDAIIDGIPPAGPDGISVTVPSG